MATIKDVAQRAGVSTATVSYVINRSRFVSEELTRRVNQAIGELAFTPSRVAQSLRRGRTSTIGLVMDDITNRFASQFTRGLENTASSEAYSIIISDLHERPENEARSISMLVDQRVDGIIYAGYGQAEEQLAELYAGGLPVVAVDKPPATAKLPSVLIDNRSSIVAALKHLKGLGHREILFINGLAVNRNAVLRAEAYREFMRNHHLPSAEDSVLFGDYTLEHGYQTTLRILEEGRKFSALLCGDDLVAFGAMAALKSRGLRVPEEVAVVGFDDDPIAAIFDPSLTTIHYPMYEMGRQSFELFLRLVRRRRKQPEHMLLDTELVVRRSTDAAFKDYYTPVNGDNT
jgi:DNA-binding LacI/PurR family transcriptional regulator